MRRCSLTGGAPIGEKLVAGSLTPGRIASVVGQRIAAGVCDAYATTLGRRSPIPSGTSQRCPALPQREASTVQIPGANVPTLSVSARRAARRGRRGKGEGKDPRTESARAGRTTGLRKMDCGWWPIFRSRRRCLSTECSGRRKRLRPVSHPRYTRMTRAHRYSCRLLRRADLR